MSATLLPRFFQFFWWL